MKKYLLIIGFCLLPWLVHGGVYQWVDKDGRVHFGNIPPQKQGEYKAGEIKHLSPPESLKKEQSKTELSERGETKQELPQKKPIPHALKKPVGNASLKNKISPKNQNTKFHDRKELKVLIEHLRKKVKSPHVMKASNAIDKQPAVLKKDQTQPPKAVENIKAVAVKAGNGEELTANEKKVPPQENAEASTKREADAKNVSTQKDEEKCGVFTGFVNSYEIRVAEECPGPHCSVYKRSLKKYKLKQKRYC